MDLVKVSTEPKKLSKYTLGRSKNVNNHKLSHEKQENSWFTSKLAPSGLPLQGWGRFSRTSFDFSSSKGVWQPRKWKRKGKKVEEMRKKWRNCCPCLCIAERSDFKFVQTETYIGAQCIGNYQKQQNQKLLQG